MDPYFDNGSVTLHHGDCLEVLRSLPDNSIDAVCTDPPYGLEFMGKEWDKFDAGRFDSGAKAGFSADGMGKGFQALPSFGGGTNPKCRTCDRWQRGRNPCHCDAPDFPNERRARSAAFGEWCELWAAECLRVLKPGGHLLAFGGSRTWHRLAVSVEDAGFEIRDSIAWLYGSGFPKSLDVSKAIDKAAHALDEWCHACASDDVIDEAWSGAIDGARLRWHEANVTCPRHDFKGWGTALKPAFEPVVVARKPLVGTVAGNVLAHGTGALNIDGCRVGAGEDRSGGGPRPERVATGGFNMSSSGERPSGGRWPANVVLDESQAEALDEQSGTLTSGANPTRRGSDKFRNAYGDFKGQQECTPARGVDKGGASRFFYVAKAPKSERPVVDGVAHPTVKPIALMRWLCRLVTPPGGTVLEPFAGSGTTIEAAMLEGFNVIGIEREADYLPLIEARITRAEATLAKVADEPTFLFDLGEETA